MKSRTLLKRSYSHFPKWATRTTSHHAANDNFKSLCFEAAPPDTVWRVIGMIVFIALCFGTFIFAPIW